MKKTKNIGILKVTAIGFAASFMQSQSRETLRTLAANAGLSTGRNKSDTIRTLVDALNTHKLHLSTYLTFRTARNHDPVTGEYDASMGESQRELLRARVRTHRPAQLDWVAARQP